VQASHELNYLLSFSCFVATHSNRTLAITTFVSIYRNTSPFEAIDDLRQKRLMVVLCFGRETRGTI